MTLFVVDDEKPALNHITSMLKQTYPQAEIFSFIKSEEAVNKANDVICDVAFLDICMGDINGIELAKKLKDINGETNIVFTTAYSKYAVDAFKIYASDYLMKPVSCEKIKHAMNQLRNPVKKNAENKLRVQCFGNFEVFLNEKPIHFKRSKAKELFAYLVDKKGAACSMNEITSSLWEDCSDTDSMRSYLRNVISDLKKTLEAVNAKSLLIKKRNTLAINCNEIICDYFDFINNIPYAVNSYKGEYMSQYSWAELTLANISHKINDNI